MPNMVGMLGRDDAHWRQWSLPRARVLFLLQDPPNRRYAQMQSRPAQRLGSFDLAHGGAQSFQTLDDIADEARKFIHRLAQVQQCIGTLVNDAFHPRSHRGWRDEAGVGRLFERPSTGSTKLEDRRALFEAIMRPALRRDLRYASSLEPDFFA